MRLSRIRARVGMAASAHAGGEHSLIVDGSGSVWSAGACGVGWSRALALFPGLFGLRRVPLPEPVSLLSASYYHNLAVGAESGRLWSWGCGTFTEDAAGEGCKPALGRGLAAADVGGLPEVVPLPLPGLGGITALAGGAYHSVVLIGGQVLTFGAAQLGQLGRMPPPGMTDASGLPVDPSPRPVEGLPPTSTASPNDDAEVASIGAGFYNTLVACRSGRLYCSGENGMGQCGRKAGDGAKNLHRMHLVEELDHQGVQVAEAAGGYCHTLVRSMKGEVFSLGCGDDGQRGDGLYAGDAGDDEDDDEDDATGDEGTRSLGQHARPVVSHVELPTEVPAVAVAAGANHSVVLAADGQVFAFGSNEFGQCGVGGGGSGDGGGGEGGDQLDYVRTPRAIMVAADRAQKHGKVVSIEAGYAHTVLKTSTGAVLVCGQNENGQLGLGSSAREGEDVVELVQMPIPGEASRLPV